MVATRSRGGPGTSSRLSTGSTAVAAAAAAEPQPQVEIIDAGNDFQRRHSHRPTTMPSSDSDAADEEVESEDEQDDNQQPVAAVQRTVPRKAGFRHNRAPQRQEQTRSIALLNSNQLVTSPAEAVKRTRNCAQRLIKPLMYLTLLAALPLLLMWSRSSVSHNPIRLVSTALQSDKCAGSTTPTGFLSSEFQDALQEHFSFFGPARPLVFTLLDDKSGSSSIDQIQRDLQCTQRVRSSWWHWLGSESDVKRLERPATQNYHAYLQHELGNNSDENSFVLVPHMESLSRSEAEEWHLWLDDVDAPQKSSIYVLHVHNPSHLVSQDKAKEAVQDLLESKWSLSGQDETLQPLLTRVVRNVVVYPSTAA